MGQTVKQTAKQVVKIPQELGRDLGGQVGGIKQPEQKPSASAASNATLSEPKQENKPQQQWKSDEERVKFLRDLYGSAGQASSADSPGQSVSSVKSSADAKAMADKEEQKKIIELRNQLHKENYYDPTFNRPQKQEERPAEKVENEKKKEMVDLQKKEDKKPQPLAVVREQNKTEMFRGASG